MDFFFAYTGSKRKENGHIADLIKGNINNITTVVEPFGGSLAFSRWLYSSVEGGKKKTYLCSDADDSLVFFCNTFPAMRDEVLDAAIMKTNELYASPKPSVDLRTYMRDVPTTNFNKLVHTLVVRKNSGCRQGFFRPAPCRFIKYTTKTTDTVEFFKYGTHYKKQDFTVYMEQVKNDENALVYLDPPYLERDNKFYVQYDLLRIFPYLAEWMATCKCKFLMVHSECAFLIEQLAKANGRFRLYKTYDKAYAVTKDKSKRTTHLVITNM
uniref:site-specific DNA-methyltransferase (adenine-specific) n=1 Tax=Tetradesmus obliquus TaxID=3088 RepID=A0A383WLW1_TETOB|eukprot:jgi/Sobl393_1/10412/SZX78243.1